MSALSAIFVLLLASSAVNAHQAPLVVSHCSTLTADNAEVLHSKSFTSFDCTSFSRTGLILTPAFGTVSGHVALVPHFSLSHKGYSDLYLYPVKTGAYVTPTKLVSSCRGIAHSVLLDSGRSITLAPSTSYDYCADYTATASGLLGSFTITWTQPHETEE